MKEKTFLNLITLFLITIILVFSFLTFKIWSCNDAGGVITKPELKCVDKQDWESQQQGIINEDALTRMNITWNGGRT